MTTLQQNMLLSSGISKLLSFNVNNVVKVRLGSKINELVGNAARKRGIQKCNTYSYV
jgi:hypothetical protein